MTECAAGGTWEARWRAGDTPWDLGAASPAVAQALREGPLANGPRRVLVPGAGAGHDAIALARAGHDVVALDIAATAVARARETIAAAGVPVAVIHGDLLAGEAKRAGPFDVVFEHTCFCALEPGDRDRYVDAVADVLAPGGALVAVLWEHGRPGGPPYDIAGALISSWFARRFREVGRIDLPPFERRPGVERLVTFALAPDDRLPVA